MRARTEGTGVARRDGCHRRVRHVGMFGAIVSMGVDARIFEHMLELVNLLHAPRFHGQPKHIFGRSDPVPFLTNRNTVVPPGMALGLTLCETIHPRAGGMRSLAQARRGAGGPGRRPGTVSVPP